MEQRYTYYACLEFKDGRVEKKRFQKREEAREYIAKNYNPELHNSRWTE